MSLDQDLVKLVREVVKAELNSSRTNATEIVGRGGDTVLSSMGNIFIQPGTNKKAYYHETEIGSGSGGGGAVSSVFGRTGAVVAVDTDYADLNMQFNSYNGIKFYGDAVYCGYISGYLAGAGVRGIAINPNVGTTAMIYAGAHPAAGHYNGLSITDSGASLKTIEGTLNLQSSTSVTLGVTTTKLTIEDAGITPTVPFTMNGQKITVLGAPSSHTDAARYENAIEVVTSASRPASPYEGQHIYETDTNLTLKWTGAAWDEMGGSAYLPLAGGTLTGNLLINKTTPSIGLETGGVTKFGIQWGGTNSELTSYLGGLIYDIPTGSQHIFKINNVEFFNIAGTGNTTITSATTPGLYFNETGTGTTLTILAASNVSLSANYGNLAFYADQTSARIITFDTYTGTRLTIADAAITVAVPLAMGSNAITTSSTVDGVDISAHATDVTTLHLPSQASQSGKFLTTNGTIASWGTVDLSAYLPLAAGSGNRLTGDLYIKKTIPQILLEDDTPTTQLQIAYAVATGSYINSPNSNFEIAKGGSTKITVGTSAITAAVDVVLGTNKLRGTAGGGSDVILGDDISMLKDVTTYGDIKNVGVLSFGSTAAQKIDNNAGSLRFTVAAGKVFEFVVSA